VLKLNTRIVQQSLGFGFFVDPKESPNPPIVFILVGFREWRKKKKKKSQIIKTSSWDQLQTDFLYF
jgi:hypothetical protein